MGTHREYPTFSSKNKTFDKGVCYVSHFLCTYVPSVLISPLLCMFVLTQREIKCCTPPLCTRSVNFLAIVSMQNTLEGFRLSMV